MGLSLPFLEISRRRFLKAMGAVTGAVALAGARPGVARAMTPPAGVRRIGLLLPHSPRVSGRSLESGMRLALRLAGAESRLELVVVPTDGGAADQVTKAADLLEKDRVDLLVLAAGPQFGDRVAPVLARYGAGLLALDSGANALRTDERTAGVFHHTLGYWQSAWALGRWTGSEVGRRAVIVSSLQESGYDAIDAFQIGFETAGGSVVATQVTHVPPGPVTWADLMSAIRAADPDVVFAQYGGALATEFVKEFAASGLAARIPLVGTPWLVDEAQLPLMGEAALGIRSVHSWAPGLPVAENAAFVTAYRELTGQEPDSLALLGYETAHLLLLPEGETRLASPRGRLRMGATFRTTEAPLYLREVRRSPAGLINAVLTPLSSPTDDDPALDPLRTATRTGWLHAHLLS